MSAIYVNAAWSGKNDGDSVTVGGKTYTIGTDAFASVANIMSAGTDLDGKTITFVDDSSVTPAAPFSTTYITIDSRYTTGNDIDGKTVTFTGNSNVSEVLWFDLNYKLPEANAPETVLKFENAYVYMTKIRPDYNSSVIISGSTLDYSRGGQNGNIYAANTGVVTIQNNSKVLSLGQLSAYGTVNVDQSELHACSANGVKGSLNITNGSTFTLSGIAIGDGGSVTIDNSTMVRKAVLAAFDDGNQSVLDWTANRELPRYRVNIGAYQGSKLTGIGTMTVKNGATFDFSSAFAAEEYKNVTDANTSAAFVTVSDGSKLVIDGRDDVGKDNKVTFNVDQLINLGDVDVSGAVLLKIGSLDGRMTVNNTTFTDGTVIGDAAAPAGCIDLIGDEINFEGTVTLNSAVNAFTTDSEGKHYSTNINIAKDAVVTLNTKQYNDGTWSGGFNCGSSDVLNVEGSLTITGDNVYLKAEALVAGTGKLHINDAGFQNTYGKLTVKGEMVITDRTGAYQNIKLAGNDNAATTGELDVDGGKLTIDGPSFAFGGGYNSTGWIDVTESSVLIQNGGTITANSTIFRNGKNNTLKLDNGTFQFTASPDFGTVHDTLGYGIFNNGAIEAVNGSTLDFSTTSFMGNSATIRIEDSVFSANEMQNSGTLAIYGTSDVTINTYVGPVAEGSPEAIMTINGIEAQVAIGDIYYAGITCKVTSDQLSALRAGESRTLLTVTGSGNAPAMSFTVDGAVLTANADGTFSSGNYVFKFEALGDDGIANDLVLTNTAPPITLSAGSTDLGGFETIAAAVAVMNADTANTAPYTITLHGTTTETQTTTLYFEKDLIISGVGTITASPEWFIGNANDANGVKVATNLTLTDGTDLKILYGASNANLQGRHDRGGAAGKASTLSLYNARISGPADMFWQGVICIVGSGNKDTDGNMIYGFKGANDTAYTANISLSQNFASQSRYPLTQLNVGLYLSNGAWLNVAGFYRMSEDEPSVYSITDSKLFVGKEVDLRKSGNVFEITGDSVVSLNKLGYKESSDEVSSGSAVFNVTGLQSEISAGSISAAITEINFTLTAAEVGALTESYTLFELTDAAAAFDANTAISVMIDGASYKLNDRITINDSIFEVALGGTDDNDLMLELLAKKPDLSTSDVYVGNLTGKDAVAVRDTINKLTVFESDGTMSVPVWGLGDWDMLDVADVNGDGVDDILISYQHDNNVTGVAALINQQDGSYGMVHQDIRGWSNDLWEYLCSADVNGDGTEDILTIETDSIAAGRDKNVNAWIMDSTGQYSEDMRICGKNTDWEIEGFGDVTGDGKADGILRFKKLVAFWEHDGKNDSVLKEVGQMSTSWKVIGSDDFTGDGLADILFGNSSAQYKLWTDIGEKSYTEINLGTMKNSSLELAGIGDFNGDGKADILWQAADGGLHWGEAESGKLNNLTTIA